MTFLWVISFIQNPGAHFCAPTPKKLPEQPSKQKDFLEWPCVKHCETLSCLHFHANLYQEHGIYDNKAPPWCVDWHWSWTSAPGEFHVAFPGDRRQGPSPGLPEISVDPAVNKPTPPICQGTSVIELWMIYLADVPQPLSAPYSES